MYNWGWPIVVYLFFGGVGAGAYLTSYGVERGILGSSSGMKRAGYFLSAPCIMIGCMLLFLDLGTAFTEPLGVLRMFLNPTSVMTWGIYILSLFIMIGMATAYFTYKNQKIPLVISSLGAMLALATASYTGILLMVVQGIPFWNTYVLPVLFVISALSTGLAACSSLCYFMDKTKVDEDKEFHKAHITVIGIELLLIILLLAPALTGMMGASATKSAQLILTGSLAIPFWVLCIGGGLLLPLARYISPGKIFDGHKEIIASDTSVLIGGLTVRAVVVFSAVRAWMF